MEIREAIDLLRDAVGDSRGIWADIGAGTGTFTLALAQTLGAGSTVYAVDNDRGAVRALHELESASGETRIIPVDADFSGPLSLPGLAGSSLDGILLANALHFVRDQTRVLTQLVAMLRGGGRVVLVEYDRRQASQWVPHPIPASRWPALAASAGLDGATITARRPSMYSGVLYVGRAAKR